MPINLEKLIEGDSHDFDSIEGMSTAFLMKSITECDTISKAASDRGTPWTNRECIAFVWLFCLEREARQRRLL